MAIKVAMMDRVMIKAREIGASPAEYKTVIWMHKSLIKNITCMSKKYRFTLFEISNTQHYCQARNLVTGKLYLGRKLRVHYYTVSVCMLLQDYRFHQYMAILSTDFDLMK